jgi:hypothetical protein
MRQAHEKADVFFTASVKIWAGVRALPSQNHEPDQSHGRGRFTSREAPQASIDGVVT